MHGEPQHVEAAGRGEEGGEGGAGEDHGGVEGGGGRDWVEEYSTVAWHDSEPESNNIHILEYSGDGLTNDKPCTECTYCTVDYCGHSLVQFRGVRRILTTGGRDGDCAVLSLK